MKTKTKSARLRAKTKTNALRAVLFLLVIGAAAPCAHAQERTWEQVTPQTSPSARFECEMVFDAARNRMVLFGGTANGGAGMNDTWLWDGVNWSQPLPSVSPSPPRWATQLVYDPVRQRVLLFGGHLGAGVDVGDTWEWDGTTWTMLTPATNPPARANAGIAFNPINGRVLMFGGRYAGELVARNDTWEWDGTNWTELFPLTVPPPRHTGRMTYDPNSGRIVMFGGTTYNDSFNDNLSDTWTWDGANWSLESPPSGSPPARNNHSLSYDATLGRVVMFGGDLGGDPAVILSDTWEWTGTDWIQPQVLAERSPSVAHAQEYEPFSGRTMAFGGLANEPYVGNALDETWFYASDNQPSCGANIQPPINADGTSIFNVKRGVVPVKFSLTCDGNQTCDLAPATIAVTRTSGGEIGVVNESVYTSPADSGSYFRIVGCQYHYNLNSKALGVGTYRVDILIDGQVVGSATFQLD